MKCSYCNADISDNQHYCPQCGMQLSRQQSSMTAPPPKKRKSLLPLILGVLLVLTAGILSFFMVHIWTEPTCTDNSVCVICGKEQDNARGHKWEDATCSKPQTCKNCGKTKGDPGEHVWMNATCETPLTCVVCGETAGAVLDHNWKDANCTDPSTCSMCGQTTGTAKGHDWELILATAPRVCSICGNSDGTPADGSSVYLNELIPFDHNGKIWTRHRNTPAFNVDTPADAPGCWYNIDVPGHTSGVVEDCCGNTFTYGLHTDGGGQIARGYFISYNLEGKYETFTGYCSFPANPISDYAYQARKSVSIYADGVLMYESPVMTKHSDCQQINFSLRGVNILTIIYAAEGGNNEAATLYDCKLS